jgi:hypothetical protein
MSWGEVLPLDRILGVEMANIGHHGGPEKALEG